ncbi:MAG: hypothetical protein M3071_24685 [Actinomycetota bacterium]|nr:hypothetical protein [Actinomycetota bacterium]
MELHAATVWALDLDVDWDSILPAEPERLPESEWESPVTTLLRRLHTRAHRIPDFELPPSEIAQAMAVLGSLNPPSRQESVDVLVDLAERINPAALWAEPAPEWMQYGLDEWGWPLGEPSEWLPEHLAAAADLGALKSPVKYQELWHPNPGETITWSTTTSLNDPYLKPIPPPSDTTIPKSTSLMRFTGIEPDTIEHVALLQWWSHLSAMAEELHTRIVDITGYVEIKSR